MINSVDYLISGRVPRVIRLSGINWFFGALSDRWRSLNWIGPWAWSFLPLSCFSWFRNWRGGHIWLEAVWPINHLYGRCSLAWERWEFKWSDLHQCLNYSTISKKIINLTSPLSTFLKSLVKGDWLSSYQSSPSQHLHVHFNLTLLSFQLYCFIS